MINSYIKKKLIQNHKNRNLNINEKELYKQLNDPWIGWGLIILGIVKIHLATTFITLLALYFGVLVIRDPKILTKMREELEKSDSVASITVWNKNEEHHLIPSKNKNIISKWFKSPFLKWILFVYVAITFPFIATILVFAICCLIALFIEDPEIIRKLDDDMDDDQNEDDQLILLDVDERMESIQRHLKKWKK